MNDMIFSSEDEKIAVQYFSRLTNTVGAVGFALVFSMLSLSEFYAWFAFFVFFVWCFSQAQQYRKMLKRVSPNARPSFWIFIKHGWLCLLSLALMISVAIGLVTQDSFFGFAL
ncbi:hypothetical protein [Vreelandella stevensii]|uniref:hypothetical protein n=1 Tax=Vreelandella stevensii TaxID=502821 RepID=UPI0012E9DBF7|nr:hypothetical protein [Halomonas stevensii]